MKIKNNKKPLLISASLIGTTTLMLSPIAVVISCRDNQVDNGIVDPVLPPTESPSNPSQPPVDSSLPIVNNDIIVNDYLSQETGTSLFNLDIFKDKTLDEIDFNLIRSAMITQDPSFISSWGVNQNWPIVKNKDLNSFTFKYSVILANNEYDYVRQDSYLTVYLPLQVNSKETLDVNSFKELAQKATNEQYLNSFKDTTLADNVMFQNIFQKDGITLWKSLIKQINAPLYYQMDEFTYDLNNDEILKCTICTKDSVPEDEFYVEYSFKIKNTSTNKYEKVVVNDNTYLRLTLGQNAIELQDLTNSSDIKTYTNNHEVTFYINITNWNK